MFSKQRERNVVRVQAAVSLGGALRDIQKTAAKETTKSLTAIKHVFGRDGIN